LWRVIHFQSDGNPLLLTDEIITVKAFDSSGSKHVNSDEERKDNGSNNYEHSNIRQWLNSSAELIEWKQNRPIAENLDDQLLPYADEIGFIADGNFTNKERSWIIPRTHIVLLTEADVNQSTSGNEIFQWIDESFETKITNYSNAYSTQLNDDVFLLSLNEFQLFVYNNRNTLGESWLTSNFTNDVKNEFKEKIGVTNNEINDYSAYWLNTPVPNSSNETLFVYKDGKTKRVGYENADTGYIGVRPALIIDKLNAYFTSGGDGTIQKPFVVDGE